jgi:predicted transcriptional regulator
MRYMVTHKAVSFPIDPATTEQLLALADADAETRESVTRNAFAEGKMRTVDPGGIVTDEDVPASSIAWLLEQGYLIPHDAPTEDEWTDLGRADTGPE